MVFIEQTSDNVSFENLDSIAEMDVASCSDVNDVNVENEESEVNEKKERKKHTSHDWNRENVFPSFEEAHKYLKEQNFTKFKETESDRVGMKFYYRCKLVPKDRKI